MCNVFSTRLEIIILVGVYDKGLAENYFLDISSSLLHL